MDYEMLIQKALEAQKFAYAPFSKFYVGAAVLTESGKVFTGCNIENTSFGATNCAERTAIFKAVSEGETKFVAMAVTSSSQAYTFPCGICRQVISEFSPHMDIVLYDAEKGIKIVKADTLLPESKLPFEMGK